MSDPEMADILRCLKAGYDEWRAAHRVGEYEWRFEGADGPFAAVVVSTIDRLDDREARSLVPAQEALTADRLTEAMHRGRCDRPPGTSKHQPGNGLRCQNAADVLAALRAASPATPDAIEPAGWCMGGTDVAGCDDENCKGHAPAPSASGDLRAALGDLDFHGLIHGRTLADRKAALNRWYAVHGATLRRVLVELDPNA